ncbi:MAG: glycosyltransferase family 9 protein [Pseudobdellovibrio sp.]
MNRKVQVVVQTAFIGDVFLCIPFLKRLRELYPEDLIIFVAKKGVADYFLKTQIIDELVTVEKGHSDSYNRILAHINSYKNIENVFCIHKSLRSALFTWKIKAKNKFGFKKGINFLFFTKSISYPMTFPDAIRQMSLLSLVDKITADKMKESDWSYLNFSDESGSFKSIPDFFSMRVHKDLFKKNSETSTLKKIAIFPGSVWETKKWPLAYYIELTQTLIRKGHSVYLMGGPEEVELVNKIYQQAPESHALAGKLKLIESIEFLKECDLIIGNDSSPSHLGASVGTPVAAIFGPTTLDLGFRPWNDQSKVIENKALSCRPCGLHGHHKCPLGHHKCMVDISVQDVLTMCNL